jgi:hypothetical protein
MRARGARLVMATTVVVVVMVLTWTQAASAAGGLVPGSTAPSFTVPTLDGGQLHFQPKVKRDGPLLFYAYNSQDAFSNAVWTTDAYLDDFLLNATHNRCTLIPLLLLRLLLVEVCVMVISCAMRVCVCVRRGQ